MSSDEVLKLHLLSERGLNVVDPSRHVSLVPDIQYPDPVEPAGGWIEAIKERGNVFTYEDMDLEEFEEILWKLDGNTEEDEKWEQI